MKTILKALMMAVLMTAFTTAITVAPAYAQTADELAENTALYKKFTDNRGSAKPEQLQIAVDAGKQYIEKYGSSADYTAQVDYIKKDVPRLEALIVKIKAKIGFDAAAARYNSSFQASKFDDTYAAGREILATNPDFLDVIIDLGSIGYDESLKTPANNKYNADTINYAKQAIQKIEGGGKADSYGVFYSYGDYARSEANKNDKYPGKDNALGNLNYKIAYLMYFSQNQKKEAIPYFYKATKYDSSVKNIPLIYQTIGDNYFEEAKRLNKESEDLAVAAGNKDTDESKAKDALAKGYADRAIDAYARAYKLASTNAGVKAQYKDGLYKLLQDLFKFRFNGKIDGLDSYVASVMSKQFVDPSTAVTPAVVEATPATTTTSTSSSLSATSTVAASTTPSPTGSSSAKTGATAAAAKTAAPAAKAKTPAKKAAPKKKGTR